MNVVAMVLGPKKKTFSDFATFLCCWLATNFEYTKTPREPFLGAYDCCLVHPMPPHTPQGACLISRAVIACEVLYVAIPQVQYKLSVWGLFLVLFLSLPIFDQFRPLQHPKVEV